MWKEEVMNRLEILSLCLRGETGKITKTWIIITGFRPGFEA
jgi:hypothetical protein